MRRDFVIGGSVLVVIALLLWGAWELDSSSASVSSKQSAPGEEFSYELPPEKDDAHSDVIIQCNEEEMEEPAVEFAKWLGLSGIPLALPGGPMALAHLDDVAVNQQFKPAQRAMIEVLKRYSPRRVVLVAHDMCLYYDTMAAWNNTLSEVRVRQTQDMDAALTVLREWFPQAEISGYIAEEKDRTLFFRPIR